MSDTDTITWVDAKTIAAQPWCPMHFASIYRATRTKGVPHWRPNPKGQSVHFPLEVCEAFFKGKPVEEHWLHGRMNIVPSAA